MFFTFLAGVSHGTGCGTTASASGYGLVTRYAAGKRATRRLWTGFIEAWFTKGADRLVSLRLDSKKCDVKLWKTLDVSLTIWWFFAHTPTHTNNTEHIHIVPVFSTQKYLHTRSNCTFHNLQIFKYYSYTIYVYIKLSLTCSYVCVCAWTHWQSIAQFL